MGTFLGVPRTITKTNKNPTLEILTEYYMDEYDEFYILICKNTL